MQTSPAPLPWRVEQTVQADIERALHENVVKGPSSEAPRERVNPPLESGKP